MTWPGNVRELFSVLQRGSILCDGNEISLADLPETRSLSRAGAKQQLQELRKQMHLPPEGINLRTLLGDIERTLIREALERCGGNQVQAAPYWVCHVTNCAIVCLISKLLSRR